MKEFCEVHKTELVTDICVNHKQIICDECKKSEHKKCRDVKKISDVCGRQGASRFQGELKVALKKLKLMEQKRKNDLENLSYHTQAALIDIEEKRKRLNQHIEGAS